MIANTRVLLKRSGVSGNTPVAGNLEFGELAINYADGTVFTKLLDGTVVDLVIPPSNNKVYVALDGDDSNDGRTEANAKRTIKAALNEAEGNTSIMIGPGVFIEKTPLIVPQFVTVHGVDQRATTVRAENPNTDIMWVTNSTYVTGLAFKGHINGARAVCFPGNVETGNVSAATANTITLDTNFAVTGAGMNNYYREMRLTISSGTGSGQSRNIVSYNATTRVAVVDSNWTTTPDTSSDYLIDIRIPTVPEPSYRWSTFITASPYLYNLASLTTTGTGMEVDGYKAAGLKSFVSAQFTQFNQGGDGVVVKNLGYAQLVSIYGICCNDAFRAETGGTASMGNCNVNFGNRGLIAIGLSPELLSAVVGFPYNKAKCARDTGLIVDALAQDLLFDGNPNSQSVFAGIQYWNQASTPTIPQTQLEAIYDVLVYLSDISGRVVINDTSGTRYQANVSQNTSFASATSVEANTVQSKYSVITNIVDVGTAGVTDIIVPNLLTPNANAAVNNAFTLLQANKQYLKAEAIAYIEAFYPDLVYDQVKCERDVGYIVDSVSFDLLYDGNRQSVQSGVYYYGYTANSAISREIPETIDAYNHIKYLTSYIVTGQTVPTLYQANVSQVITANVATSAQSANTNTRIDLITNIIQNGPSVAPNASPIGLTANSNLNVANAAFLLYQNREFIKQEVVSYIDYKYAGNNQTGFVLNVSHVIANTDPKNNITSNTKPYIGLVCHIGNETVTVDNVTSNVYRTIIASNTVGNITTLELDTNIQIAFPANTAVKFYQKSALSASGQTFEYVGSGTSVATALPRNGGQIIQENEVVEEDGGTVYYTATDQFGNFRIGSDLLINFNTGTLSGRTFTKSLFAQITPFVLALDSY
jgi:hypothetical protein